MKLLVTDIDDTLSVGEVVSDEVRAACGRLRQSGWEMMIATGRTLGTAKNHIDAVQTLHPAILYDGSRLMTRDGSEIIASKLKSDLAAAILNAIWDLPLEIQITGDEEIYCRQKDVETSRFYKNAGVPVHFISEPVIYGPVYRIGLWLKPEISGEITEKLKKLFPKDIEVTRGGCEFMDILPQGVSKGTTLEKFISTLPSQPEVIVAAGDHMNDFEMLNYANIAAVPRNAASPLLEIADIIMPIALEHGMAHLIDYLLSDKFDAGLPGSAPLYL